MPTIPPVFDLEFLEWFRAATEAGWAQAEPLTLEDYRAAGVGGLRWAQGTRWAEGLSDGQIDGVEREWGFRFAPEHRLFLRHLHCTDRDMVGAMFDEDNELQLASYPGVYDWLTQADDIRGALEDVLDGIVFDVEHNQLWLAAWGERPDSEAERATVVAAAIAAAPRLAPIFGHRFVLASNLVGADSDGEAEAARDPACVISIHQSDAIIYGVGMRDYLLHEFRDVGGWELPPQPMPEAPEVPFWLGLRSDR